jgi:hypothetical protein
MRRRLGDRSRSIPTFAVPALRFVYHKRAGEILKEREAHVSKS